ncbi:MAG: DSD1 family PLP-dependent enzyme [Pseudomonadota bacterium]|nr:DSD1 family PLP-dependent enzyme [Pseudomonadota bacterium]
MNRQGLNDGLIGVPGGRARLATPALVVDLDRLEANIAAMAAFAESRGIALRPHAKTHKCVEISRRQIAAGAKGICVAKLGEAEAQADGGIESILITSPVVTEGGMARLMALNARVPELMAVCDNSDVAARLSVAAAASGKPLALLVDIDPGLGRTGILPGAGAFDLVEQVAESAGLIYAGLQCYAGQVQHMESANERRAASLAALKDLRDLIETLEDAGLAPGIVSGGGTGTFDIDPEAGVLSELQVGSYVFMDRQYNDVWSKSGGRPPFATSLFVQTTVISANRAGLATTDAGFKSFATDAEAPQIASGAPEGANYFFFGDEQGGILYSGEPKLVPGSIVSCVVPHCDPTVNLYDRIHAVRGDTLEAIWVVEGRGRSA